MTGDVVRIEEERRVAVVIIDNPPVNASSVEVRKGLLSALKMVSENPAYEAVVLIGHGANFIAGSDIREFAGPIPEPQLPMVIEAVEGCKLPVVAAIRGAALGGGFELALACDGRIASPDAVVGLPEVHLGIIPGAGGTVRLPRLVGPSKAISLIAGGRRIAAREACDCGLVDTIATDVRAAAMDHALTLTTKRLVRDFPVPDEDAETVQRIAEEALKRGRGRPAIVEAVEAVRRAIALPPGEALEKERAVFQRLRASKEAEALRHLFFAERQTAQLPELRDIAAAEVVRIGVIGAGTMGAGIAACFVDAGIPVLLVDPDEAALRRAVARIRDGLKKAVAAARMEEADADERNGLITTDTRLEIVAEVDLAIEAVIEDLSIKSNLLRDLDRLLKPGAIIASNTSYLDLDKLAAATERPCDVVGLHFFNPAEVMRLLEVVRGRATSPSTLKTAFRLAKRINKLPIVAGVCEGFIGNRINAAYRMQCEIMLEEGCLPEQIDQALEGFGFARGPFAVWDMSGLDIAWRTRQRLIETRDPSARYVAILNRLCEQGRLGRKSGLGWYRYDGGSASPDPHVQALIEAGSTAQQIVRRPFEPREIVRRALAAMINESLLILGEKIARSASDIDLTLVHGFGFPAHKGGPLFWAAQHGHDCLTSILDELERVSGLDFRRGDTSLITPITTPTRHAP